MGFAANNKTRDMSNQDGRVLKTYKRRVRRHTIPMISEEIIFEIIARQSTTCSRSHTVHVSLQGLACHYLRPILRTLCPTVTDL